MLASRTLLDRHGVTLGDIACRHPAGLGHETECSDGYALVFVRRGCFVRCADGSEELLDPTVAFCTSPGQEQRYDHPGDGGDDCTMIALDDGTAATLAGGDPGLPTSPIPVPPAIDLQHRRLLAATRHDADPEALYEHAINLAALTLEQHDPRRIPTGRPNTRTARVRLVNEARESLATDTNRSLPELAHQLAVSPHHLSRVFRAHTGNTVSQYRLLLRTRAALERIAGGESNLARIATDVGFADQSHLCRALRRQTNRTPTAVRSLLS